MDKVIYSGRNAPRAADKDFPTQTVVTEETNGFAVWDMDGDGCYEFRAFYRDRDEAIESGVMLALISQKRILILKRGSQ